MFGTGYGIEILGQGMLADDALGCILFLILLLCVAIALFLSVKRRRAMLISGLILILLLCTSFVVGIFRDPPHYNRKQTLAWQATILDAVETYHASTRHYPLIPADKSNGTEVMRQLMANGKSKNIRSHLPQDALRKEDNAPLDAWGRLMRFEQPGGQNSPPVIVSAGPDGDFGDTNPSAAKDNIRSDGQ